MSVERVAYGMGSRDSLDYPNALALWLGARRLKTIDGLWIMGSSLYLIVLNV